MKRLKNLLSSHRERPLDSQDDIDSQDAMTSSGIRRVTLTRRVREAFSRVIALTCFSAS